MYDEQKVDDCNMDVNRASDVFRNDDAPDDWEALVDDKNLDECYKDKKDALKEIQ